MNDLHNNNGNNEGKQSNVVPFGKLQKPRSQSHSIEVPEDNGLAQPPAGFYMSEDGVYEVRQVGDDKEALDYVKICSPIIVRGFCRSVDGNGWGRVVDIVDPDGNTHRLIIEEASLSGGAAALLRPLSELGFIVEPVSKASQSVMNLLSAWRPSRRFIRAEAFGWVDDGYSSFVLGSGGIVGSADVVHQNLLSDASRAMSAKGTLAEWRDNVGVKCVGNPLMVLAISHALTGPLLKPLSIDGGGFHFRGASSRGKSTLLGVAASVWGAPSFVQSWRGTDNGIEGLAATCSGSLLILDELHQVDPKIAGEIVYMTANGRGKSRSQNNGRVQQTARWSVPLLSSGEISLEEHMASGGKKIYAGQEIRLLDILADSRKFGAFDCLHETKSGGEFAEQMQELTSNNYGTLGKEFVKILMSKMGVIADVQGFVDSFGKMARGKTCIPFDGQIQRAVRRFALAAAAGEIATNFGLTGWPKGTALNACMALFIEWIAERDDATRSEIEECVGKTRNYLLSNLDRFSAISPELETGQKGWRDDNYFYISSEAWSEIHDGNDAIDAARIHKGEGFLRTQKNSGFQYRMCRRVITRPRVYAVASSILVR